MSDEEAIAKFERLMEHLIEWQRIEMEGMVLFWNPPDFAVVRRRMADEPVPPGIFSDSGEPG